MDPPIARRTFLKHSTILGAAVAARSASFSARAADAPNNRLGVAVMGLGRGLDHIRALLQIPNVEIGWLCDVDSRRFANAMKLVEAKQARAPKTVADFRRILADKEVDALFIATPNYWHAPATILACAAGKHVYVEQPGSHNPREGEWMVAAARQNKRLVQLGTQRRSCPQVIEAIARLRAGEIGKLLFARTWYDNGRASIGLGQPAPLPAGLDWNLWQGPCPERPYQDNLVHYHWHWRWHYGGGELANNGPHALDLARWGLDVTTPSRVTCNGGRYHFSDDQETPDTINATWHFGDRGISFDGSSCLPRTHEHHAFVSFYGEKGVLALTGGGSYKIFDPNGKEISAVTGKLADLPHFENFTNAIRQGTPLNAEIEEGQKATLLCHLGNIAWRTGAVLSPNPRSGQLAAPADAAKLWSREYRPGWEPKV